MFLILDGAFLYLPFPFPDLVFAYLVLECSLQPNLYFHVFSATGVRSNTTLEENQINAVTHTHVFQNNKLTSSV